MAPGDVAVIIVSSPLSASSIDTALTSLRATAGVNGHYMMTSISGQVILAAITEV